MKTILGALFLAPLLHAMPATAQQSALASYTGAGIEHHTGNGIDIAALNNNSLAGGVIGFYTLFDDRQEVIATAYLLNHDPKRRAFQTFDEYKALRDGFVRDFTSCMAAMNHVDKPAS
ncbi:MAG: hypothetical protein JWP72_3233 [Massilia sp.]|nr:hypothetical protein [Massilia sp.]